MLTKINPVESVYFWGKSWYFKTKGWINQSIRGDDGYTFVMILSKYFDKICVHKWIIN